MKVLPPPEVLNRPALYIGLGDHCRVAFIHSFYFDGVGPKRLGC